MSKKINRTILISVIALGLIPLVLFTNATDSSGRFDEELMQCKGISALGANTLGVKSDSTELKDCARISNISLDLGSLPDSIRGADVMGALIEGVGQKPFVLKGTNIFGLKSEDKEFTSIELNRSALIDPSISNTVFLTGKIENSKWAGSEGSTQTHVSHSEMKKVSFIGSEIANLKFEDFTGHNLNFDSTLFRDTDLSMAKLFDIKMSKVAACGELNFRNSYFSRSEIEFSTDLACGKKTSFQFSGANLRGNTLRMTLAALSQANFDDSDLRGADLSGLRLEQGAWSFKNAKIDSTTRLPSGFGAYSSQVSQARAGGQ